MVRSQIRLYFKRRSQYILILFCFLIGLFLYLKTSAQNSNADSLKKLLAIVKEDTVQIKVLKELGLYYWERNPDSAMYYSQQLITLGKIKNNESAEVHGISRFGKALNNKGNYPKALEMLLLALRKFEKLKDTSMISNVYNHIGNVFKGQENYAEAIKYYLLCKRLAESTNDNTNLLVSTMNLGLVYLRINKVDSALLNEQQAYSISMISKDEGLRANILYNLGLIHFKSDDKEIAKAYFLSGIQLAKKLQQNKQLSMFYYQIANNYFKEKRIDSSMVYAGLALNVAGLAQFTENVYKASGLISKIYEDQHRLDSAFIYNKISTSAKDSLFNKERSQQIENLSFNEKMHQEQNADIILKAKVNRNRNMEYVVIVIALLTFIILFLLLSRSIIVKEKFIEFFGILALLAVFELINLFINPYLVHATNDSPVLMLLFLVGIGALLAPLHHKLEKWLTKMMVEKNKKIRLAAAKKTIATLEGEQTK